VQECIQLCVLLFVTLVTNDLSELDEIELLSLFKQYVGKRLGLQNFRRIERAV